MSNTTSTVNETISSNETSSSSPAATVKEEAEENTVASMMPYWRANRQPSVKESQEKAEEYQPRPAKYRNNYEDLGVNAPGVGLPYWKKPLIGTITTDTFANLADPTKQTKKDEKTSEESKEVAANKTQPAVANATAPAK